MYPNYSLEDSALEISFSHSFRKKGFMFSLGFSTVFNSEIVLNIKKNSEISFLSLIAHSFKYLLSSIPIREDRVKRHVVFWASLVALDSLPTLCLMREAAAVQIRSSWALQTDALAPKRLGRLLIWVS